MKNVIFLEASFYQNFTKTHTILKVEVSECKKKLILIASHSPSYEESQFDYTPERINSKGAGLVAQFNRGIVDDLKFSSSSYGNKYGLCIAKTDENGFIELCKHGEGDSEKF